MPILALEDVLPNTVASQDIYESNKSKMPLLRKGTVITAEYLYGLRRRGIEGLHVKEALYTDEDGFVISRPAKKRDTSLAGMPFEKSRAPILPKTRREIIKGLRNLHLAIGGRDKDSVVMSINQLADLIADIVEGMLENPENPINITTLQSDQEFVYHHCLSVAVMSLATGQAMGLSTYELMQLGRCAVLHDLGKFMLPPDILLKTDPLTPEEEDLMRTHSELGYDSLKLWNVCTENERMAIFSHHERLNGSGYPDGLEGDKIPLWGRIIAVSEVYDVMTNTPPPVLPTSPGKASEYLLAHSGFFFDTEVVQAFHKRIEFYPLGSFVLLSDGQFALVTNSKNSLRPILRVLGINTEIDLNEPRFQGTSVVRIVSYREALNRRR
ncbi:MAG: HD domain-containing protein [Defluviitaleaceae bacterium]|nr:HD domain-containing protein [Defluviitaleaceae bacterium]